MSFKINKTAFYIISGLVFFLALLIITFQYSRFWQRALFFDPLYQIRTTEKVVALTFDDGPSPQRTPPLLDLLDKYQIKATFFMLGNNIEQYPEITQTVHDRGHLIGNHSYDHPRLIFKSPSFITQQITATDELIKTTGQSVVNYFRPPYSSKYIILPLVLRSLDKTLVTGTYDPPAQYGSPLDAHQMADEVITHTEPGSIIYLHDGKDSDAEQFIQAVELIITGLQDAGYEFVLIDYPAS